MKKIAFPKFVKALEVLYKYNYESMDDQGKYGVYTSPMGAELVNVLKDDNEPEANEIDGKRGMDLINDFFAYLVGNPDSSQTDIQANPGTPNPEKK
jgi:hypothetical protein